MWVKMHKNNILRGNVFYAFSGGESEEYARDVLDTFRRFIAFAQKFEFSNKRLSSSAYYVRVVCDAFF